MTRSMTGFASINTHLGDTEVKWEVRSVNSRYLELHFRLPDNFRSIEPRLRDLLRQKLSRGKVEVFLKVHESLFNHQVKIDVDQVQSLLSAVAEIEASLPASSVLSPLDILKWPGVLHQQTSTDVSDEQLIESFNEVLNNLVAVRAHEGEKLKAIIERRIKHIEQRLSELRHALPDLLARQESLLKDRIKRLVSDVDPLRLEQEAVLLIQKADVEEELDRLAVHTSEVRRILNQDQPIGRRLDFLMQELNREANTLSSKSIAMLSTQVAVDLKVLIEQMREQIQNIE